MKGEGRKDVKLAVNGPASLHNEVICWKLHGQIKFSTPKAHRLTPTDACYPPRLAFSRLKRIIAQRADWSVRAQDRSS